MDRIRPLSIRNSSACCCIAICAFWRAPRRGSDNSLASDTALGWGVVTLKRLSVRKSVFCDFTHLLFALYPFVKPESPGVLADTSTLEGVYE